MQSRADTEVAELGTKPVPAGEQSQSCPHATHSPWEILGKHCQGLWGSGLPWLQGSSPSSRKQARPGHKSWGIWWHL